MWQPSSQASLLIAITEVAEQIWRLQCLLAQFIVIVSNLVAISVYFVEELLTSFFTAPIGASF